MNVFWKEMKYGKWKGGVMYDGRGWSIENGKGA